jgi:hypothetical protein
MGYTMLHFDGELPTHFEITIEKSLSWEATWQLVVHEWAHCLAWQQDHDTVSDHGPEFGLAFAHVWGDVIEP